MSKFKCAGVIPAPACMIQLTRASKKTTPTMRKQEVSGETKKTIMKIPENRQANLLDFVTLKHDQQKRKYTNEPYITHLIAVADMADGHCKLGYEIGLLHDLLEDTDCPENEMIQALDRFGYTYPEIVFIGRRVHELTDVYTPEKFTKMNRKTRKELEANRLHKVGYAAQTVKYCDLIDNTKSIVKYDKGFAVKYLAEKRDILNGMNRGNKEMYSKCLDVLHEAQIELDKQLV